MNILKPIVSKSLHPVENILKFTARLTEEEKEFIEYFRKNKLHLRELMQG